MKILLITLIGFYSINYTSTTEEIKLYNLINSYRKENNLPAIPMSLKLNMVAKIHCKDLYDNFKRDSCDCIEHSWSDKGVWKPVCYTKDHARKEEMWNKPFQITGYNGNGFEIEHNHIPKEDPCNAQCAINGWKSSHGHNIIMINKEEWKDIKLKAMGVGIYKGYACVWFGDIEDK